MDPQEEQVFRLMSTPVVALHPTTSVSALLGLSKRLCIHHFPLVDFSGLCGLVCTCDLEGARPDEAVSRFSHREPVAVHPQASLREAAEQMTLRGVGSVVIADEEGVWGILTREDLVAAVPELAHSHHCIHCGSRQHLRPRADHTLVCPACAERELDRGSE